MSNFFNFLGVDAEPQSDGGWGVIGAPSDKSNTETNDANSMFQKLYGSLDAAIGAIGNAAAQRITSTGQIIGNRIAQPTARQGEKIVEQSSNSTATPITNSSVLWVVVGIMVFGLLIMFGRRA